MLLMLAWFEGGGEWERGWFLEIRHIHVQQEDRADEGLAGAYKRVCA